MKPDEQERFFRGAAEHGNLPDAAWDVLSSPELCMRGDHEGHAKDALRRAFAASRATLQAKVEELEEERQHWEDAAARIMEKKIDATDRIRELERRLGAEVIRADNNFNRVEVLERQLHEPGYVDELRAILEEAGTVLHGLGLPTEPFGEGPSLPNQIRALGKRRDAEVAGLRAGIREAIGCLGAGCHITAKKILTALASARETEGEGEG